MSKNGDWVWVRVKDQTLRLDRHLMSIWLQYLEKETADFISRVAIMYRRQNNGRWLENIRRIRLTRKKNSVFGLSNVYVDLQLISSCEKERKKKWEKMKVKFRQILTIIWKNGNTISVRKILRIIVFFIKVNNKRHVTLNIVSWIRMVKRKKRKKNSTFGDTVHCKISTL